MLTQNPVPSSEDELTVGAIREPIRYEFQSFLEDDEDDPFKILMQHQNQRQPATEDARDVPMTEDTPEPADSPMAVDVQSPIEGQEESDFDDEITGPGEVDTNGAVNGIESDVVSGYRDRSCRVVDIEVGLRWMSPALRADFDYVKVPEYVAGEEPLPQRELRNRPKASDDDYRLAGGLDSVGSDRRKRKRDDDEEEFSGNDFDEDDLDEDDREEYDSEEDDLETRRPRISRHRNTKKNQPTRRASTRGSSRYASVDADEPSEAGRGKRKLRPRVETRRSNSFQNDEKDELQDSDNGKDPDFFFIQSDIAKHKKRKRFRKLAVRSRSSASRLRKGGDSDIEFEARRSSRANKNTRNMKDTNPDDEEAYYVDEKAAATPKVLSVREIFQPVPVEFKEVHQTVCDTCGYGEMPNKGPLVPCQGCSIVQHKACLGTRSTREQRVTKVGVDSFAMQCRFCLRTHVKKDERAPCYDTCQGCHAKGVSCAPFSERKTPKQEEIMRSENDGVDPITPVEPRLVNNPKNVLFRCTRCHRGWHYEHMPHPNGTRDPAVADPLNLWKHRKDEYQITWTCKDCQGTEDKRIGKLVAWRPVSRSIYTKGQSITDFTEDQVEYLLKWENKSYHHCAWMPGAWVYGVIKPAMRKAFIRRTFGEMADEEELKDDAAKDSLLRWTEKEAIIDAWITPDIILDVHYAPASKANEQKYKQYSQKARYLHDLDRVLHVIKIYVKFEGLGYDDVVWDSPPDPESPMYDAFLDAYQEYLNGKHFQTDNWKSMKERIDNFRTLDFVKEIEVKEQPQGLRRGKLMMYQLEGLNWMLHRLRLGENAILADEMGLGKTVQVVALLSSIIQDSPKVWPFLIVVPNATCPNWRREIKKWAPDLRVVAYYGGRVSQTLALEYELFPERSRELKAHVVIMSYDSIKDPETKNKFSSVHWAGLVVDEAQALKNDENGLYKALRGLKVPFKLLLTGTPLQNNKRELFNLLQFVDPNINATELDKKFETITKDNLPELHNLIRPYFLRRTKAGVLTFLPPMAQIIIPVSMSVLQERLCKSIMARNPDLIRSVFARGKLKPTDRGSLSNILMQLRKCLCHPFVYSQAIEDRFTAPDVMRRNLVEASSKLVLLEVMLPKLKERGHRVLMFSQFLEQLTILEDFLAGLDMRYERLDGSQSSLEKQKRIDSFNAPDSKVFIMLLSTRAGGVGINLATADTVIILDPDWNPHQDIQALSRAHRIGQKKKVLCFQLMTVDSAEEKILQIGRKKMALDHLLIETMDDKEGEAANDVESVLKHGAAALFGDGQKKEAIVYDEAAVNKLLDRSVAEETKADGDKWADGDDADLDAMQRANKATGSAESAFAFARVWTQDKGDFTDELPADERVINASVWDEILQQREEEARREAEKKMETLGRGGRRRGATTYTTQKFDFEDLQDAPVDSDHSSADEEFVGAGESDGESSDDEMPSSPGKSAHGESSINGANRTTQGKGVVQGLEINTPRPTIQAPDSVVEGPKAFKPKRISQVPVPQIPIANYKSQTPRPETKGSGNADKGRKGQGNAQADAHNPRHANGTVIANPQPQPVAGANTSTDRRPPAGPVPVATSAARPSGSGAQRGTGSGSARVPINAYVESLRTQKTLKEPCIVCSFLHPAVWECPEMKSEVKLRLALDKLRGVTNQDVQILRDKKAFLVEKILKVASSATAEL